MIRHLSGCLLLSLLGYLGNWFKLELFFNVDFLFGSFFVMLAILLIGQGYGVIVGLIAATCTYFLWHHPWAVIIMGGEALFVGSVYSRRRGNLVLYDMLYWLCIGMPLVYLFYHHVMAIQTQATILIMLKQSVNGVINALMATLAHTLLSLGRKASGRRIAYSQLIFVVMASLVLLPPTFSLIVGMRMYLKHGMEDLGARVSSTCAMARSSVAGWIEEHHQVIQTLSLVIGDPDKSPFAEMQRYVETIKAATPAFFRMGVLNESSLTVAYSPPVDENGKSTLGVDFSDRPYISVMKETRRPYIPNVVMGKFGNPIPIVLLLAPLVVEDKYRGYCAGVVDTSYITNVLSGLAEEGGIQITLVDGNGKVIAGTAPGLKLMEPFHRPYTSDGGLQLPETRHWIPAPQPGTSIMQRWRGSFLFRTVPVGPDYGWKLVVEAPVLPLLENLSRYSIIGLSVLTFLILSTVTLSHLFSSLIVSTIVKLQKITMAFPGQIDSAGQIQWPQSKIVELDGLSHSFQNMTLALGSSLRQQIALNESLEERVRERTEEIEEREVFVRDVLDSLTAHIAVLDVEARIVAVNAEWKRFARENGGENSTLHVGADYLDACKVDIHGENDESPLQALHGIRAVMEGSQERFSLEYPCHSPTEQRWFRLQVSRLSNFRRGVVVAHENITEQRRANELMKAERDLGLELSKPMSPADGWSICLRKAVQVSHMDCGGIYLVDETDGSLELGVHAGLTECFVRSVSSLSADSENARLIHEGKPVYSRHEDLMVHMDEDRRREGLKALAVIPINFHGKVVACLNVASHVLNDVPEYSRSSLERIAGHMGTLLIHAKQEREIAQSHRDLETLFNTITDFLFILDEEGNIIHCNAVVEERLGYVHNELIGKPVLMLHPEDRREEAQAIITAMLAGEKDACPVPLRKKDGGLIAVETIVQKGFWRDGQALVGISRDITRRIRAEQERLQLEQRLLQAQKAESLSRMAGAIAHNFNNLLSVVLGNLELVLDDLPQSAKLHGRVAQAMKASQRAAEISRFMLTYLGQTAGKKEPWDLAQAVSDSRSLLITSIPASVHLTVELPSQGPIIHADGVHIKQILTNLVSNAVEAMGDGGGHITVGLEVVTAEKVPESGIFPVDWKPKERSYARLWVADTGPGLDAATIERIFDPFFTTRFTGRGLGLPVVLGLMRAYEGAVTAESKPGRGATFSVYFPVPEREKVPLEEKTPAPSHLEGGGLVLVVDDEPMIHYMAEAMLKQMGYETIAACDGAEATEIFRACKDDFCLVLLDLSMPGMNGWETLAALRAIRQDIPVIFASGYDEAQVMQEHHTEGPQAFIHKPYQMADLKAALVKAREAWSHEHRTS